MTEATDPAQSPVLRKRDVIPPLIGASLLLLIDGYLLLPGIGLMLASLMMLASLFALLGKQLRGRGGRTKAAFKLAVYALCLGGIYLLHAVHRADARINAVPVIAAADQYRLAEGRYPDNVDELVPAYLPALPRATWRLNPGRYHIDVDRESGEAQLWWPAHLRVALTYNFRNGTWDDVVWD